MAKRKKKTAKKRAVKKTTKRKTTKRKATKRKTTKRKATKKKATRKKAKKAAPTRSAKVSPAKKPRTKSEVFNVIAEQTGLVRKEVQSVFESFGTIIAADLGKRGPGVIQVPGLMKIVVKRMPAKRARKGINPFTKEPTTFKAKPARNVVKVRPLMALKQMV